MMVSDVTRTSAVLDPPAPRALSDAGVKAPRIIEELNDLVGKSRRRSRLRRVGSACARWLDQLVPPTPPASSDWDPPPRFPFF
jgi:hypothetical protein